MSLRRPLLLAVAALLVASAVLAIAVLLFGDFGATEGRILGTTAALAVHGVLVVPATVLLDRGRARPLALALVVVAVASAAAWMGVIWADGSSEGLWRVVTTSGALLVAGAQAAAMTARARAGDPPVVRALYVASCILATAIAGILIAVIWLEPESATIARVLAALGVADLGAVALQPLLARAAVPPVPARLRVTLEGGAVRDLDEHGDDLAAAMAAAVRRLESEGERVVRVEVLGRGDAPGARGPRAPAS